MKIVFNVSGRKVPLKSLQYISKENQLEVMRNWFFENFENPVESCPYNGREGGYAYIYGGPYDASEELQKMFSQYVKEAYVDELTEELQEQSYEWSGNTNNLDDWYNEDLYDAVTSSGSPFIKFVENINSIKELAKDTSTKNQRNHLLSLLYTNVITALETFYVELFINSIEKDDVYIADYIEKGKTEFKVSKQIAALLFKGESIDNIRKELTQAIKEHLISASWHSTNQVIKRYKATFDINVQKEWPIDAIEFATQTRNHLVHRGSKDKEGNPVVITEQDLEQLLAHAIILGNNLKVSLENAILKKEKSNLDTQLHDGEF